jgi:hypothetical protein
MAFDLAGARQNKRELDRTVRHRDVCRRLMSVPGVGTQTALAFLTSVDKPDRFRRAQDLGPSLGFTPRRYQSGEVDRSGRISKCGDRLTRSLFFEAAGVLLSRSKTHCALRTWATGVWRRSGYSKARVALARKLAVVILTIWRSGSVRATVGLVAFPWTQQESETFARTTDCCCSDTRASHQGRAHDGQIITIRLNLRWTSDGFEIACWDGRAVRVAFALDTCDRDVIAWCASTSGISGEMIRDMMLEAEEKRFGGSSTPKPIQWLSDNGSCYRAQVLFDQSLTFPRYEACVARLRRFVVRFVLINTTWTYVRLVNAVRGTGEPVQAWPRP